MRTRYFALIFGFLYLIVGILGFVPGLLTAPADAPPMALGGSFGLLFGLFPVNWLHSVVHFLLGLWGIVAWRSFGASRGYARSLAIIFGALAVLGLIPGLWTLFGLVPLYGHDIWLHAVTAVVSAYFGWASVPATATTTTTSGTTYRH